ncbi:MAG: vanadium-dependent haloperoxidase [Gemmatimonadaceae bacterium]|nr:vanadium-dependent haloperoxidase [Gemmatimonadaceae bacterium]
MSRRPWFAAVLVLLTAACGGTADERPFAPTAPTEAMAEHRGASAADAAVRDAVMSGNAQAIAAAAALVPPGVPLPPFVESRLYAIANVAMHDALNSVRPEYERYADNAAIDREADAAVAVLTAARDAIKGAAPGAAVATDAWYTSAVAAHLGAEGFDDAVALGERAAASILARRADDGTAGGGVAPYTPGTAVGDYQFTFPFNTPGFDFFGTGGFADGSAWASSVTPFVVRSTAQFRAPRPYLAPNNAAAVRTRWYARDYNEVKALGCVGCTARTATQTEIAQFWVESSPAGWNRIARVVAEQQHLRAHETARMFALLQLGEFDVYATNLESKYHYNFWRPVTAVALADVDGNAQTASVADWQVLTFPTPPVPDYPSAHAAAGGAAAAIIESVVQGRVRAFSTTSTSLPGVTRRFSGVVDAARENADSRVYVGYHFRHATDVGLWQGYAVGLYVAKTSLPKRTR